MFDNLGVIEKKVLGALMIMADKDNIVKATTVLIAKTVGYKSPGGALTFALKILERDNFIIPIGKYTYKILI